MPPSSPRRCIIARVLLEVGEEDDAQCAVLVLVLMVMIVLGARLTQPRCGSMKSSIALTPFSFGIRAD